MAKRTNRIANPQEKKSSSPKKVEQVKRTAENVGEIQISAVLEKGGGSHKEEMGAC